MNFGMKLFKADAALLHKYCTTSRSALRFPCAS